MRLTATQIDALQELIDIGIGHAAGVLNAMLRSHIGLQIPAVETLSSQELKARKKEMDKRVLSAVRLGFRGPFSGSASLIFPAESAVKLVVLITEDDMMPTDLDAITIGTLTEVGNIVLNGVMGAIGSEIKERIFYSVPTFVDNPVEITREQNDVNSIGTVIWVQTRFTIQEHQIDGDIILMFEAASLDLLLAAIDREMGVEPHDA